MKRTMLTAVLVLIASTGYGWRSFSRFLLGAEANGVGGAYVADASSEIAMNYNPAGLVQIDKTFSVNYEVSSAIEVGNILSTGLLKDILNMDYFPFFSAMYSAGKWKFGTSLSTRFCLYTTGDDLNVRSWKFTAAYPILDNLSVGFGIGPVFALEGDSRGYSFDWNLGVLWKPAPRLQLGAALQSPIDVNWTIASVGASLYEHYPLIAEAGLDWAVSPLSYLFFSLEYVDMDSVKYVVNGTDDSPVFGANVFARLHPHAGIRFLERFTGAHISFGMMIDSAYFDGGSYNLYLLTAGVRAYGRNAVFNFSLIDSLLFGLVAPYSPHEEKFDASFSFKFL